MRNHEHDVFISYTGTDAELAAVIHEDLGGLGMGVWFDRFDMPEGHDGDAPGIRRVLLQAMRASRALVILVSPRSMASRWVRFELGSAIELEARQRDRRIVTLLVGRGSRRDIPFEFDDRYLYDLTGNFLPRYRMARGEILRDLGVPPHRMI